MSNICASCLVCLFVLAFLGCIGIIPYIGIDTCSWLSDFEDWADEVNTIVSSDSTNCTNERKLYNLIDDIDAFITITYIFTGIGIYYAIVFLAMSCNVVLKSELIEVCSKEKCVGLNFLIHIAANGVFLWQYFYMSDLLENVNNNSDSCGFGNNQDILNESETYYDYLNSFPTQYILYVVIAEISSLCLITCIMMKIANDDDDNSIAKSSGTAIGANSNSVAMSSIAMSQAGATRSYNYGGNSSAAAASTSRAVVPANRNAGEGGLAAMFASAGGSGGSGAGRGRTDSEVQREQAAVFVGALVFTVYGFEFASQENCDDAMRKLERTQCGNQTALRDAIALGITRMLKLKQHLTRLNAFDHNFIHIVLTDGEDNKSELKEAEFLALQHVLDREDFHKICKTIFIGVNLSATAERDLRLYSILGGEHAQFEKCDTMDIESVFDHISINLIQRTRVAAIQTDRGAVMFGSRERAAVLGLNHFLVLFTLDISGSMAGTRWNAVKRAVKSLLNNLKSSDIFGIVLFNDKTKIITGAGDD